MTEAKSCVCEGTNVINSQKDTKFAVDPPPLADYAVHENKILQ